MPSPLVLLFLLCWFQGLGPVPEECFALTLPYSLSSLTSVARSPE